MKLTRASSYALHAVAYMAGQKKGEPVASHIIAQDRKIPERFLLKVLKPLVSAQILHSIKGPNGGYRLAKPANEITMLDVVEAVDGPIRGTAPVNPKKPESLLDRKLDRVCGDIADTLRKQLGKVRMSELGTRD
jgi:Rrf2 family transcriptional regulator, cysteine metabolism repressor